MTADQSYFSVRALEKTRDPLHSVRWHIIQHLLEDPTKGTLKPMTIVFGDYLGAGHIRYMFPNSGRVLKNVGADGYLHSVRPGKDSWRFFKDPMLDMHALAKDGLPVQHLLCADFRPEGTKVKDLYPLLLVEAAAVAKGRALSAQVDEASKGGSEGYLFECVIRNDRFLGVQS